MAIIKTIRNPMNFAALLEDPQPGSDTLFIQTDAYSKTTLNYLLDEGLIFTTSGQVGGNYGYSAPQPTWGFGGHLMLAGETTYVRHSSFNTQATYLNNLDLAPFASMDTNYKITPMKYFTDGTNNLVIGNYNINYPSSNGSQFNFSYPETFTKVNTTPSDFLNSGFVTSRATHNLQANIAQFGNLFATYDGCTSFPVYRNPVTNNLIWVTNLSYSNAGTNGVAYQPGSIPATGWTGAFSASQTRIGLATGVASNVTSQLVGVSKLDGYSIQVQIGITNDNSHVYYKWNDGPNTLSTLATITAAPTVAGSTGTGAYTLSTATYINTTTLSFAFTATNNITTFTGTATVFGTVLFVTQTRNGTQPLLLGMTITSIVSTSGSTLSLLASNTATTIIGYGQGTNQGGDRTTNFGQQIPKFASKTFPDIFSTGTMVGYYIPYLDATGKYHPYYTQWNQTNDSFARFSDITIYYPSGTSQSTYWSHDNVSGTSLSQNHGQQRAWYNETFLSGGTRYLIFMQLHGAGGVYDSNPLLRTFMTFSISTGSYKVLTYHSSIVVPSTPKNICWLNDDRTLLAVVAHSFTYIYYFNSTTGFQLTSTFPYQYHSIGRDNLGRVWAHDTGPVGYGRIHLLSGVPATINVVSSATTYNYAGTAIPTTFAVDAYDLTGSRMTATVNLSVVGNSLKFTTTSGSTTYLSSLTVVTNSSTSTVVYGTVVSNGYSNITTTYTI